MKKFASIAPVLLMILMSFTHKTPVPENQYPFEVKITGHGNQSIIFIPGFACSGDVWNETVAKYKNDYKCYVLTMAGFAGVKPEADPTFKKWEDGVADYIRQNKILKPVIVGHSMGGGIAIALAADYPDLISKIIVVDAVPCLAALENPLFTAKENDDCNPVITQIMAISDSQFLQMQKLTMGRLVADTSMRDTVLNWSLHSDRKTFAKMYCDFMNTDLRNKIKNIHCPNLVMLETYFKNMKPQIEEQFHPWKNANIKYADKGLHFIMYDDKPWYFDQLNDFLKP